MKGIKEKILGILICIVIAGVSTLLAGLNIGSFSFEVIGAPVFAIVIGMVITAIFKNFAGSKKNQGRHYFYFKENSAMGCNYPWFYT